MYLYIDIKKKKHTCVSLIFCPCSTLWPGLQADCRARIVGCPELQTNTNHWRSARPDLWPEADRWLARHCHPLHTCTLGGPGWGCRCDAFGCLGNDFTVDSGFLNMFIYVFFLFAEYNIKLLLTDSLCPVFKSFPGWLQAARSWINW